MRIPYTLDVPTLPEIMLELAVDYWWAVAITALLVVGAIAGIIFFSKKNKKSDK